MSHLSYLEYAPFSRDLNPSQASRLGHVYKREANKTALDWLPGATLLGSRNAASSHVTSLGSDMDGPNFVSWNILFNV